MLQLVVHHLHLLPVLRLVSFKLCLQLLDLKHFVFLYRLLLCELLPHFFVSLELLSMSLAGGWFTYYVGG